MTINTKQMLRSVGIVRPCFHLANPPIRRSFPFSSMLTFHSLDTVDQFRPDGRCGPKFTKNGRPGQCRRNKETQCCNAQGFCSNFAPENCRCRTCIDFVFEDDIPRDHPYKSSESSIGTFHGQNLSVRYIHCFKVKHCIQKAQYWYTVRARHQVV